VLPAKRVGIFYLAWHAFAASAMAQIPAAEQLTIEDVVQSDTASFADIVANRGLMDSAVSFHYQARPKLGFYCLYRKRPAEAAYPEYPLLHDCPNISAVAEQHAHQLWDAGVDFVYTDLTNIPFYNDFSDVLGIRPLEVLFEEWAALRARGVLTPQIAGWVPAPAKAAGQDSWTWTWEKILDIYNDPRFDDLVLRDSSGKKILFLSAADSNSVTAANEAAIQSNGGRNDVVPVLMWALEQPADLSAGKGSFMQPCQAGGKFTTLVPANTACNQGHTTNSPIGTMLSVSTSYQIYGWASLPFEATGRNNGLTFKKQFETAFAVQPDWLFINEWNELIAQPQNNPYAAALGNLGRSMGMGRISIGDPSQDWLWTDPYGAEFMRDIEPTDQYGSAYYDLMRSCIKVYQSGVTSCQPASEPCCQIADELALVHSLRRNDPNNLLNTDHILTKDESEKSGYLLSGKWEQVCNPGMAPPGMCSKTANLSADGPFQLFTQGGADRVALYRCLAGGTSGFFSGDANCEGRTVVGLLGYMSTKHTTASPRPLRRCLHAAGDHFHWLDLACPSTSVTDEGFMGWVR
jgi:hypothetical protein